MEKVVAKIENLQPDQVREVLQLLLDRLNLEVVGEGGFHYNYRNLELREKHRG